MSEDLCFTPASELAARIRRRDLSPVEVVEAFLDRIKARNDRTNAYVTVIEHAAREAARKAERAVGSGAPLGRLHGVPIAIKDLFDFKAGVRNTFGSKPLAGSTPRESATHVERLEGAGAIVLGNTNTSEFGHKGVTDNFLFGPTSTPFAPGKNAGGSSGGSAAAVADGLCAVALGSDGGGSIRIPASFCGVYGFKASFGRVASASRSDAFLSHTPFIHFGPLARTVGDAAFVLSVMAGPHPRDPFSLPDDCADFVAVTRRSAEGLKVAYSSDLGIFPVDRRVREIVGEAVQAFEEAGALVKEVEVGIRRSQWELCELWMRQIGVLNAEVLEGMKAAGIDLLGEHRGELTPQHVGLVESAHGMSALEYKLDSGSIVDLYALRCVTSLLPPSFRLVRAAAVQKHPETQDRT